MSTHAQPYTSATNEEQVYYLQDFSFFNLSVIKYMNIAHFVAGQ